MGGTNERDRFFTHRLITRARLALREKAVLWVLWDFENSRTGLAWPSADTISAMSGLSRREVFRAIKQLTTRGVLQLHARTPRMAQRAIDYERLERDCTPTGTPPEPAPSEVPIGHTEVSGGHSEVPGGHSEVPYRHGEVSNGHPIIRRTQEEKKREHAPPTFLSASRKGPKAGHPGASDVSMNDLSHEEFEARLREMMGRTKEVRDA